VLRNRQQKHTANPLKSANRNALFSASINATVPEKSDGYDYFGSNRATYSGVNVQLIPEQKCHSLRRATTKLTSIFFYCRYLYRVKGLFLLWREEYLGLIGESSVAGLVF